MDFANVIAITIAAGTPVLFATLGEILTERSGVLNLGLEGLMLVGALTAFAAAITTGNPWAGVGTALLGGAALALIHAFFAITIGVNQVVSGLALVLLGQGIAAFFGRGFVGQSLTHSISPLALPLLADLPFVGAALFRHDGLVYLSWVLVALLVVYIGYTRPGLNLRAVGDSPATADALGIRVDRTRYIYVCVGGALCGLGGGYLSLAYIPSWNENVTAGRGWIAVGLVIFALWSPVRALVGAYLFGFADGLGFQLQVAGSSASLLGFNLSQINPFFFKMLPYLVVIAALAISQWRLTRRKDAPSPPLALGQLYARSNKE